MSTKSNKRILIKPTKATFKLVNKPVNKPVNKLVRVGRRVGTTDPRVEGFKNILCLTPSTPYGSLGPYCLTDEQNRNMENIWQFSKVYPTVNSVSIKYSRFDKTIGIIWARGAETHVLTNPADTTGLVRIKDTDMYLTPAYFQWREDGQHTTYAIRYPVGKSNMKHCLGALTDQELERYNKGEIDAVQLLGYVESRKQIYLPVFDRLVRLQPKFKLLQARLQKDNLLIVEVDGPHQDSLPYYQNKYGVADDFIQDETILVTTENLSLLLNDEKHSYGHGYVLAAALLNLTIN